MFKSLLFTLSFFVFIGIKTGNAQSKTDSLTQLIEEENDLSKKNKLYLERALSFSPKQKDKAFQDIASAKKHYQKQNDKKGLIDVELTISDFNFLMQNYKEASKSDSIGIKLSKEENYKEGLARSHGNLGRDLISMGNFQQAEAHINKAIELQENLSQVDYNELAELYNRLSIISSENGKIAESLKHIEKAIEMAQKVNNNTILMRLYLNNAISYNRISKYELSIQNNLKVIELAKQLNDDQNLLKAYNNSAITYKHLKEYDKAIDFHSKGLQLATQVGNYKSLGLAQMNLATIYVLKDQMEGVDTLYHQSIENFKKINDQNSLAMAYHNYGNYFIYKKNPEKAIENLKIALDLRRKYSPPPATASTLGILGKLMIEENDLTQAEKYLLEAEQLMQNRKENRILFEIYIHLKNLYAAKGDYKKAFQYQEKGMGLIEELYNEDEKVNTLKTQTDFDLKMQEYEHQISEQEQQKRQFYIISVATIVILILILILVIFWLRRIQIKEKHQSELVRVQQKHKIDLAESLAKTEQNERKKIAEKLHDETVGILSIAKLNVDQLSADLFVADSDAQGKLHTAQNLLQQASESIREISHTLMPVTLEKLGLKDAIEDLISSINTSKTIKVESVIEGLENSKNWDVQFNLTIYRMIQEVFNNIIKHSQASHVLLQIMELEDSLTIFIEDNGKGFEPDNTISDGIGLGLLKQNIEFFNGIVEINGKPNKGTFVLAELPIKTK